MIKAGFAGDDVPRAVSEQCGPSTLHQGDYQIEPKECAISTSLAITFGIGATGIQGVTGEEIILKLTPANKINLRTFFVITPKVSANVYQEEGLHNTFIV